MLQFSNFFYKDYISSLFSWIPPLLLALHLSWKSRKRHTCHFVPLIFFFLLSLSLSSFPELCPWPFVPLFLLSQIQTFQICFSISGLSLAWQNLQDVFLWPKRSWNVTISTPLSFWCFSFSSTSIFKGVLSSLNSTTACPYSTLFYYQKKKKKSVILNLLFNHIRVYF